MYKTTNTFVTSPQGNIGLDTAPYDTNMTLVSDNTIDFTAYPARQACKDLSGRLPNVYELQAIYAGRIYYGDNFPIDQWGHSFHRSATEVSNEYGNEAWGMEFVSGGTYTIGKMDSTYVRCVTG